MAGDTCQRGCGVIEIKGLHKVVDQGLALQLDALTVELGQVVAVVGPAGSGRHALLELLIGRERPSSGTVRVAGVDPATDRYAFGQRAGVLFADDSLYRQRSSLANLQFYCRLRGLPRARAAEVLAEVGLADRAATRVDRLSSGMARRLAFACAIVHHPAALLLAEPFARCDDATMALFTSLMRRLAAGGAALLVLDDDAGRVAAVCDVVHVLAQGRIVESYQPGRQPPADLPFKIPVRLEGKVSLLNPGDILYAAAEEGHTLLHTTTGRLAAPFTLNELETRLARSGFFRAHRGYLVNLQRVKEVSPYTRNSFSLILDDAAETEIPLSKAAARELQELLGY